MSFVRFVRAAALAAAAVFLCACSAPAPAATTPPPARMSATLPPQASSTPSLSPAPSASSAATATSEKVPPMPAKLKAAEGAEPTVKVYVVEKKAVEEMPVETYLQGVLAGEMKNDWPLEALKAQAILARTFALQFIADKGGSQYEGAHLSTDIKEAQAYDASGVNERIKQAIEETRGRVIASDGALVYAWFHAHSGGVTALAKEGLEYERAEPGYTQSVESPDSPNAPPEDARWTARFPQATVLQALSKMGVNLSKISSISVSRKGPSGRAETLSVNGQSVSAPSLRLALGGMKLKSTLLTSVSVEGDEVVFQGKGYGHGVGMSQWGAYALAENGQKAEDIIAHYFKDVGVVSMWK